MRDRRINTRFDVMGVPYISGKTSKSPSGEQLVTISIAGCGFASLVDDFKLRAGDVLDCEFKIEGLPAAEIKAALLYTNPYPIQGLIGRFYGLRFLGDYESKMRPIIDRLEALKMEGKIAVAP